MDLNSGSLQIEDVFADSHIFGGQKEVKQPNTYIKEPLKSDISIICPPQCASHVSWSSLRCFYTLTRVHL